MTIMEAISAADGLRNNHIDEQIKKAWLSELDGRIFYELIRPYGKQDEFTGYGADTASDTALIVPYPYDSLYVTYLEMQIARQNNEMPRYNNAAVVFNEQYSAFRRWYSRNNVKPSVGISFPTRGN
ncbi:MAG: hypothetical protein IJ002_03155 [Clostridia bacterium]|nr:hypothetical protein [Clostridia bacterium]MBQ8836490.1 hypothetical protein [Clostridia bacterium]